MIRGKQTTALLIATVGFALLVLAGCGGSSPAVKTAQDALEQKNYDEALSSIERALEQDSTNTDAYLLRAKVLRRMTDSSMAPDEYKALHTRAWEAEEQALSFEGGLREDVQARRKRVYDREVARGEKAYNLGNKKEVEERYRRAISFFGAAGIVSPDSARPVLNEAFARMRVGQREEVIPVLEEYFMRADPGSKRAYRVLGQLYLSAGQSTQAVDLLDRATRVYPSDQKLQALRLNAYNRAGDVDEALEVYREQIEQRPVNASYRYNYGALLLKAERYGEAIAQLKKSIEIRPAHLESQYNLGAAYVNAALARDDSIAAIEKGKLGLPDSVETQARIDSLAQKREFLFEKAVPPLERVRELGTASSTIRRDACRALMVAYVQTNRPNRAAEVEKCTGFTKPDT